MKNKKLIDLYKEWMETGYMGEPQRSGGGLCNSIPEEYDASFLLIRPESSDRRQLEEEKVDHIFWASNLPKRTKYKELAFSMTELRQTLILLICAIHNEL